jgi:hypothetical protein
MNKIDNFCNIQGYYFGRFSNGHNGGYSIMIFKDGTIAQNIHLGTGINEVQTGDYLYKNRDWGIYSIKNKTIIAQIFHSSMSSSGLVESEFKIVNDSTIWLISEKIISGGSDGSIYYNDTNSEFGIEAMNFRKLESKPDSSCWLKEKKRFWCDKEKYKAYMIRLKEEKRNKKK